MKVGCALAFVGMYVLLILETYPSPSYSFLASASLATRVLKEGDERCSYLQQFYLVSVVACRAKFIFLNSLSGALSSPSVCDLDTLLFILVLSCEVRDRLQSTTAC